MDINDNIRRERHCCWVIWKSIQKVVKSENPSDVFCKIRIEREFLVQTHHQIESTLFQLKFEDVWTKLLLKMNYWMKEIRTAAFVKPSFQNKYFHWSFSVVVVLYSRGTDISNFIGSDQKVALYQLVVF